MEPIFFRFFHVKSKNNIIRSNWMPIKWINQLWQTGRGPPDAWTNVTGWPSADIIIFISSWILMYLQKNPQIIFKRRKNCHNLSNRRYFLAVKKHRRKQPGREHCFSYCTGFRILGPPVQCRFSTCELASSALSSVVKDKCTKNDAGLFFYWTQKIKNNVVHQNLIEWWHSATRVPLRYSSSTIPQNRPSS